jgi:hypothetical protein
LGQKCSKPKGRAGDDEDLAELSKVQVKHRPIAGQKKGIEHREEAV